MNERIKTIKEKLNNLGLYKICVLLITLAIVVSAVFWCGSILKKQAYYERQEMRQYYQDMRQYYQYMRDRGIKISESRLPPSPPDL